MVRYFVQARTFASADFGQSARSLDISITEVPVEAHDGVGKIERYYGSFR